MEPFIIETNVSNWGVGDVLMQNDHPKAFHYRKFGPRLHKTLAYIKELHVVKEVASK